MRNGQFKSGKNWNGNAAGRPKGSKTRHKATLIKEAFFQAFEDVGGTKALVDWAKSNRNKKEFYKIIASLLPKDIDVGVKDETWEKYKDIPIRVLEEKLDALFNRNKNRKRNSSAPNKA